MRKHKHNKRLFIEFMKHTSDRTLSACNDLIDKFTNGILDYQALFDMKLPRNELRKRTKVMLDEMRDVFVSAAMQTAVLTLFTMPAKYKKLWLYMSGDEPTLPNVCKSKSVRKAK